METFGIEAEMEKISETFHVPSSDDVVMNSLHNKAPRDK